MTSSLYRFVGMYSMATIRLRDVEFVDVELDRTRRSVYIDTRAGLKYNRKSRSELTEDAGLSEADL